MNRFAEDVSLSRRLGVVNYVAWWSLLSAAIACIKRHASVASKGNPCVHCRVQGKRAKQALVCAVWQASEVSPCVRAMAGPPQELANWPLSAHILLVFIEYAPANIIICSSK